jgi:hypothetical protein
MSGLVRMKVVVYSGLVRLFFEAGRGSKREEGQASNITFS